jgi:hypothetical protein
MMYYIDMRKLPQADLPSSEQIEKKEGMNITL